MTLSEKIISLRTKNNLLQGDLAEKMGVSRQSVSKWETGASIPDLDKIIYLADLFGVTVDELVKDKTTLKNKEPEVSQVVSSIPSERSTQKIIASCLLILGGISAILGFSILPSLLFLAIYLLGCSIICFSVKHHAGLVISWITFLGLTILSPYIFGNLSFYIAVWVGLAITFLWTIYEIYKNKRKNNKKSKLHYR